MCLETILFLIFGFHPQNPLNNFKAFIMLIVEQKKLEATLNISY